MKHLLFGLLLTLLLPSALLAAEVINLKVGQSGDKGFATYDLAGKVGEREAEVSVSLTINGEKFPSEKLTLTGDFGKKIKTGVGKRIVWDILADIPTGFDGEVVWNVDTVSSSPTAAGTSLPQASSDSPFEFKELVARDKNTGMLWLRNISKESVNLSKARGVAHKLKVEKYAGCSDWQLPYLEDLTRIFSYASAAGYTGGKGKGSPADYFNAIGFTGITSDFYWSESIDPNYGFPHEQRMAVDFEDGVPARKSIPKDYLQFWPVCKPD